MSTSFEALTIVLVMVMVMMMMMMMVMVMSTCFEALTMVLASSLLWLFSTSPRLRHLHIIVTKTLLTTSIMI